MIIPQLDRLHSQLLTSGLSQKNNPLFQVIDQLIKAIRQGVDELQGEIVAITATSGPTPPAVTTTNVTGFPPLNEPMEDDIGVGEIVSGRAGVFPYFKKGSVIFSDGVKLTEDNAKLFYDEVNDWFGVGKIPVYPLDVKGPGQDIGYIAQFEESNVIGSTFLQIRTPAGANAQAGFTL